MEDLVQWMADRQKDLQEAMLSGRIHDVTRLAKLVAYGGAQLKISLPWSRTWCHECGIVASTDPVRGVRSPPRRALYGLRGVRVVEASNPGPVTWGSARQHS